LLPNQLDKTEAQELAELREIYQTTNSAGWVRIKDLMQGLVDEAHEDMIGNTSAEPMTYMHKQLRWQQREAMMRGVLDYIAQCDHDRKRILDEITEREKERNTSYADSPRTEAVA